MLGAATPVIEGRRYWACRVIILLAEQEPPGTGDVTAGIWAAKVGGIVC